MPYYWAGLKAYDLVAGTQGLTISRYTTPAESRRQFPTLAEHGPDKSSLKGTVSAHYAWEFTSILALLRSVRCRPTGTCADGMKTEPHCNLARTTDEILTYVHNAWLMVGMCLVQIVYYDGQFDDSRLNVSLACTAAMAGATVLNYTEVTRLLKV